MKNWWRPDEERWTDDEQMINSRWTDDELMRNWWWTDDKLMIHWWWTDGELMVNWWWTDDEQMMNRWWTDDELMMKKWWTDDELMMNWWWTDDELMNWSGLVCQRLPQTTTDYHRQPQTTTDYHRLPQTTTDCHRLPLTDWFYSIELYITLNTIEWKVNSNFLSDPGIPGPIYGSKYLKLSKRPFWNLTDVTLADEDTNSIQTADVNRAIIGNVAMQVAPSGVQTCN